MLGESTRLRDYVQDRPSGVIRAPNGTVVAGLAVPVWKGRNKPRRADRRWDHPAGAGNTAARSASPHSSRDHPRGRREHIGSASPARSSSDHSRGRRWQRQPEEKSGLRVGVPCSLAHAPYR